MPSTSSQLSDTQQAILAFIAERIEADGLPPSQTEIARAFGFKGVRAAQYHLEALEVAGAIERIPGRARGIRVLWTPESPQSTLDFTVESNNEEALPDDALRLPVLGRVAAGAPIGSGMDEYAEPDAVYLLDLHLFSPKPDYLLRVSGDSMRDEGIFDGDLIGVHRTRDARNGQIVVARIDEEITVKQLSMRPDRLRLLPRNPDYEPIEVRTDQDFAIEGLYCGLLRPNH
ncbi:MAG: transcriptional repressor LexA [Rhodanobacteraceae bacterium]|nr:transcriptional repressor LexA [Xanthomonadales bacterium]MCP5478641.1 transcriptional repressor LexA [Rhodanobacteraceae bacterium]HPF73445.1 transcriptional repressor LexA [Xanthomonadaceae bacterium]HRX99840.1 transcriptional repressor LexA [Xanthomonadaceae bacterium]